MIRKIIDFIFDKICCNFFIPYFFIQIYFSYQLHKQIHAKNNVKNDYIKTIISCLDEKDSSVYIIVNWRAWEASFYYIFLYKYLKVLYKNNNKITIIWNENYIDILDLYKIKSGFVNFLYTKRNLLEFWSEMDFRINFNLWSEWTFIDMREVQKMRDIAFLKEKKSNSKYFHELKNMIDDCDVDDTNKLFKYSKVDIKRMENLIFSYSNKWKLIIFNLENKSYKLARKDTIPFQLYIEWLRKIAKNINKKFIINSVYNKEKCKFYEDVSVLSLNYQEIIYLANHWVIDLFVSERNWLNDVFNVFYPEIPQIIYYPDYYNPCVDKGIYNKIFKETLPYNNVIDFWRISEKNIIEDLRINFFNTVEKNILKLITK